MPRVSAAFGERIRRGRLTGGMSQRAVARKAAENGYELSFSTVRDMESGIVSGPEKVLAYALTVGDNPDTLLGKAGWPFRYDPQVVEDAKTSDQRGVGRREHPSMVGALA